MSLNWSQVLHRPRAAFTSVTQTARPQDEQTRKWLLQVPFAQTGQSLMSPTR
jgi:hypothetical protein